MFLVVGRFCYQYRQDLAAFLVVGGILLLVSEMDVACLLAVLPVLEETPYRYSLSILLVVEGLDCCAPLHLLCTGRLPIFDW